MQFRFVSINRMAAIKVRVFNFDDPVRPNPLANMGFFIFFNLSFFQALSIAADPQARKLIVQKPHTLHPHTLHFNTPHPTAHSPHLQAVGYGHNELCLPRVTK